ncbi:cytochrome o ubiquinol oxidase subunit IV [Sulfobacillus thermosulfidooxidans]|uniref:Cytochrome aa3-600 menaquinol oxidase subunit 4 n=2 Tax=Sulfobacillus thermosulfidooxidans TaxID=28034 RepID=A0A1W1WFB4_SULTA|nr:cytochrome C oxidase subunit IV family protein [Sulfobacillus thermosulfidooxidans]OLZ08278.1 cytochrome C oxidase subunit IV [Sulfobacillus thermosulfidooxidans]OLZ13972.1 cytochrome C oxidase subunit IV [Sulfobacillus thermosulfidooxidans]OLZ19936.1 cytochrome C oxidase subunit IV [Sulfobacillus thermosulfidooxidans]PSR25812.1 MAG: cytochrome C oxidase subunit IV [Sulfobacillus thermosulfidooxidans]SMC04935.1 cytochrome aa3-600 menaquinol oxidase subunit 4 [Sulfobacillus thermosulfidooxid
MAISHNRKRHNVIAISPNGPTGHGDEVESVYLVPRFEEETFPWKQIFGYIASLVLTALAFGAVVEHMLPPAFLISFILFLAVLQAALQLGIFMHLRESRGSTWQIVTLALAIFMGIGIVIFSIWIMTFKSGVS